MKPHVPFLNIDVERVFMSKTSKCVKQDVESLKCGGLTDRDKDEVGSTENRA